MTPRKKDAKRPHLGPRGWKPTDEQRRQVEILVAARVTEAEIARLFQVSHVTLRRHCRNELDYGFAKRTAEVVLAQFQAAVDGKVSAQQAFLKRADAMPLLERLKPVASEQAKKAPKLGKKEQALLDAQNPDTNTSMGQRMARRVAEAGALH